MVVLLGGRRSCARGEERERERERAKQHGFPGIRWMAVSITLHPVTRFPGELFPAIRHARRAERMNGCSLVRPFARRYRDETVAVVHASIHPFSGLLSSGMRHFSAEECTSRRNTNAFLKLAVLSRGSYDISIYLSIDIGAVIFGRELLRSH